MTDEELKNLAKDMWAQRIFSSCHMADEDELNHIFLPLAFLHGESLQAFKDTDPGFIYEYLDKAGPRSVNGMPTFFSYRYLNKADAEKMFSYYRDIESRMDSL